MELHNCIVLDTKRKVKIAWGFYLKEISDGLEQVSLCLFDAKSLPELGKKAYSIDSCPLRRKKVNEHWQSYLKCLILESTYPIDPSAREIHLGALGAIYCKRVSQITHTNIGRYSSVQKILSYQL